MNCTEIQNNLIDYVERGLSITASEQSEHEGEAPCGFATGGGDTSPYNSGNMNAHLMGCVPCRQEVQALQQLFTALKNDTLTDPGEAYWQNFSTRIHSQIKKEQRRDRIQKLWEGWKLFWTAGFPTPAFGVALSILLVIGGFFLMTVRPLDKRTPGSLAQVVSASKISPEGVELILSLGDDPYDVASDSTFNTDEDMGMDI